MKLVGWLRRLSLSQQLIFMTVSTSALVLTVALAVLLVVDGVMYLRELGSTLASVAEVVADANTATLAFDDQRAAEESLAALADNVVVAAATILDENGEVFAEYVKPGTDAGAGRRGTLRGEGSASLGSLVSVFRSGTLLRVERPISLDAESLGHVVVLGELSQLEARREWYTYLFLALLAVFGGAAFVCAVLFERAITEPIRTLAANMRRVSANQDYSIRAAGAGDDEVGTLITVFNEMLDRIEDQSGALAQHKDHLEELVAQRTGELDDAKHELEVTVDAMKVATKATEAASAAKSDFLARMSHEIRTPLNGVLGMLELVSQGQLSRPQKRNIEAALRSGEALLHVINEILDFSKIEAGRLVIDHIEFDPWTTIEDAVDLFAESVHRKGLELTCLIDDAVPVRAVGDPVRLRQVLVNLVGNAVKFTPEGEVAVRVDTVRCTESSANLRIRVRDTGPGIPPHLRKHLFDAFAQADVSITRRFGGTGLGLAIARQLVQAMGGEIGFVTDRLRGTTFEATVQLALPDGGLAVEPLDYDALHGVGAVVAGGSQTLRDVLETHMRSWGMDVFQVHELSGPLPEIAHACGDLIVVLDAAAADASGRELVARVDAHLPDANTHVVHLVGPPGVARDGLEPPGRALSRPVHKSSLAAVLVAAVTGVDADDGVKADAEESATAPYDLRILLAEDNQVNQEVAVGMLESLGCRVDLVANGEDAIRETSCRRYDLIFMDCQMPHIDGYRATVRIRCDEQANGHSRVPIVALTAHAEEGARDKCINAGMDDYLAKPFEIAQLAAMLDRWCGRAVIGPVDPARCESAGNAAGAAPVAEVADQEVLATEVLEKLRRLPGRDGADFLRRVLSAYRETSTELMTKLQHAVADDSAEGVSEAAHGLKSCSENVGAVGLAHLCRELERRARDEPASGWDDLVQRIEDVFPRVLAATEDAIPQGQLR